jgi:hypothetical protein
MALAGGYRFIISILQIGRNVFGNAITEIVEGFKKVF